MPIRNMAAYPGQAYAAPFSFWNIRSYPMTVKIKLLIHLIALYAQFWL